MDDGEKIAETALREVEEECGISQLRLERFFKCTYHMYDTSKHRILKETHWFIMHAAADQTPVPEAEEDIEIAAWYSLKEATEFLKDSYANLKELMKSYLSSP
jgi:ADP-ribose pyrophosphatase YjhB (NUDIX family)